MSYMSNKARKWAALKEPEEEREEEEEMNQEELMVDVVRKDEELERQVEGMKRTCYVCKMDHGTGKKKSAKGKKGKWMACVRCPRWVWAGCMEDREEAGGFLCFECEKTAVRQEEMLKGVEWDKGDGHGYDTDDDGFDTQRRRREIATARI